MRNTNRNNWLNSLCFETFIRYCYW